MVTFRLPALRPLAIIVGWVGRLLSGAEEDECSAAGIVEEHLLRRTLISFSRE